LQGNRTFGHLYPTFDTYTKKVTKQAKKDDVLMSVRAPVGDLNFAPCDLCIGRGLASMRSKEGNNKFIYYALKYNIRNLLRQGAATTFDSVNKDVINDFELVVPEDKSLRDKVANILSALDEKIELNHLINAELESMAKTLYDYWFVQFDFPDKNGKLYKSSGGKMVWNAELKREIPEGWGIQNLMNNSLADLIKPGIDKFQGEKFYLATADVTNNDINFGADKITYENRESRANMQPVKNSLWFAKMKNSKKILYFGEYSNDFLNKIILSTGFTGLKCNKESLEYLWCFINNDNFEFLKDRLAGDKTTQSAINNEAIALIPLTIPDAIMMQRFHKKTYNIYKKIYLNQLENQELCELRDWLLPMLMNGQVKVN